MAEQAGQGRGGRTGQDAQHELAAAEVRPDLAADLAEHLGLDPEQDDVGALDGLDIGGDRPDAVFALEVLAPLGARVAGDDLRRVDELAAEQAGDHRLGHHAGADGRDRGLRQGGHRAEYSRGRQPFGPPARFGRPTACQAAMATPVRKKRPVVVTRASSKPAGAARPRGRRGS